MLAKPTLLVVGASGLLGEKVASIGVSKFDVTGTFKSTQVKTKDFHMKYLDITDFSMVSELFRKINPSVVINAAAMTNVDQCERNVDMAVSINALGARNVAQACKEIGAKLIHISTDVVFDGSKRLYNEQDEPNPINVYGKTKLLGEEYVQKALANHVIIRSSVLYGYTSRPVIEDGSPTKALNFALWVVSSLSSKKTIRVVNDQYSTPTLADDLAQNICRVLESKRTGIYHVAGKTCLSRYEFALKIATTLNLDKDLITLITSSELHQEALRPKHTCLDCTKAKRECGVRTMTVDEGIEYMKKQIQGFA